MDTGRQPGNGFSLPSGPSPQMHAGRTKNTGSGAAARVLYNPEIHRRRSNAIIPSKQGPPAEPVTALDQDEHSLPSPPLVHKSLLKPTKHSQADDKRLPGDSNLVEADSTPASSIPSHAQSSFSWL